jgi:hypothetical protein
VINFIAALKMIPVEKMSNATHFKPVDGEFWQVASPDDKDAMELGLNQIDLNLLQKPNFTIVTSDFKILYPHILGRGD